ncbi:M949_RS01915 family surface polysaccharide biosynthesis protein [Kineococcus sp. NUM-3379]
MAGAVLLLPGCGSPGAATPAAPAAVSPSGVPVAAAAAPAGLGGVEHLDRAAAAARAGLGAAQAGPAGGADGAGLRFTDAAGENVVVLTRTEVPGGVDLTADHVVLAPGAAPRLLRRVTDGVAGCGAGVTAGFVPASLQVADADGDGTGEVTFAYLTACRGDVSPGVLKLLLLEGAEKHAVRGGTWFPEDPATQERSRPGVPDPDPGRWPAGTVDAALATFEYFRGTAEAAVARETGKTGPAGP